MLELSEASSPESSTSSSLETVVNLSDRLLVLQPAGSLNSAIFPVESCGNCACAIRTGLKKKTNYASIMLDALKGQLCSKLCRHNIRTPITETNFLHSHLCLSNFVTNGSSRLSDTAIEYAKPLFAIATNSNLDHIHMMSLN